MRLWRPCLALIPGILALASTLSAQQPTPPPGSPGATTSIDGKPLPPPDPPFTN
jgi:arylsulfatase